MNTTTTRTPAIDATVTPARLPGDGSGYLDLAFSNGKNLQLRLGDLSPAILEQAVLHGLKQKLVDAAAISRDTDTGRPATIDTKFEAVREVYERLLAGEWNKTRSGEGVATGGLLLRALLRMYDGRKTKEELLTFIATKTDAEKAALRASPKVAPIIAAIKDEDAARKGSGVDADDLLADLG